MSLFIGSESLFGVHVNFQGWNIVKNSR